MKTVISLLLMIAIPLSASAAGEVEVRTYSDRPDTFWSSTSAADRTDTTAETMKGGVAGSYNYVSSICCANTSATATRLQIENGAGTALWNFYLGANAGLCHSFPVPLRGTLSSSVNFKAITTATATRCSANGFTLSY